MAIPGHMTQVNYRATLHVVHNDNDGVAFPAKHMQAIDAEVKMCYPAGTRQSVGIDGWWTADDGKVYDDPQTLYHVDVAHENDIHKLRIIAERVCLLLKQECVYVTVHKLHSYLV